MSRVDWGWVATVTVIVWSFAYCALYAIRRGGRTIRTARTHHRRSNR